MKQTAKSFIHQITSSLNSIYGEEEARSIAYQLLQEAFGFSRNQLILNEELIIDEAHLTTLIKRLVNKEPLQHIIGKTVFYDGEFLVSPQVLIPRPETEELVDLIVKRHQNDESFKVLDIGTGSGCIPISIKKHIPQAAVWAMDISQEALHIAEQNAKANEVEIDFIQQDILAKNLSEFPFLDAIVSNPPYIRESEKELMHQNVLDFEPHLALFVPTDKPLKFYERITALASQQLQKKGYLYFEINEAFGQTCKEMVEAFGFEQVEILKDMQGKDRMLQARKKHS